MKLDAKKLREERLAKGYSRSALSWNSEVSEGSIIRAERGLEIRPITARRLARALELEVGDLWPPEQREQELTRIPA